jgi:hypothetical protein
MNNSEFSSRWREIEDSKKPLIQQKEAIQTELVKLTSEQEKLTSEYLRANASRVKNKAVLKNAYTNEEINVLLF